MVIGQENREVEREKMAILRIISNSHGPVGSKIIARQLLNGYGISLSERAVRYHLGLLDKKGLTVKVSRRDGREITSRGLEELDNAMVSDKVGFTIDKIETLAYKSSFNPDTLNGRIPVNISFFPKEKKKDVFRAMSGAIKAGFCVSHLVMLAEEGKKLADITVPNGSVGLATVCGIVINATLLEAGIPMDSHFGGILQFSDGKPRRFTELINYAGSSLDPSEIFIASKMTDVNGAVKTGEGKILANFREIPAICLSQAKGVIAKLKEAGINGVMLYGEPSKSVCEIQAGLSKVGIVLVGGLNPIAAAAENGIESINSAMSKLVDFKELKSFWEVTS